jgi:hypothetical protein
MFIGREKELKVLENQYRSGKFEFTVLYGRRRIGKTHLLKQFMVGKKAIYYMATESGEISNLELLSKTVLQNENKGPKATFSSYEDLFDYVGDLAQKERLIFVIDEYPYLAESWPAISSVIQKYCDHLWKGTRLHLILCGSSMSFMENQVLGAKSPLYGRRTAQIKLKEFNYFETEKFLRGMDKETIATLHCATGGVAEYLTYVDKKASLESNLVSLFLTDTGRLYEEPMNYLKQELREPKVYNNILDAIARGASRNNEIAMKVHLASGALNKYLQQLIDLGIVAKETPVGGKSNRKSIYRIRDGSFRFWYRFVFPNSSVIQLGQGQRLYREYIKSSLSEYMGEGFEEIFFDFFDWMNKKGEFSVLMTQRGRWWGNNPAKKREEEIDLVGMGENTVVLGEVKWRKEQTNMAVLKNLMEKGHFFQAEEKYFVLFSKNGFTKDVKEYAAKEPTIILKDFLAET